MRYAEDENCIFLQNNYRNPKQIVEMANHLSQKRMELFGKDKRNDLIEEIARCHHTGNVYMMKGSYKEQMKLLKEAVKKAYVYIVVATQKEKSLLEDVLGHQTRIFTVSEIKGLENKYIIVVHLLRSYKEKWLQIMKALEASQQIEEHALYRYLFNMLYVTLTRSKAHLCFIESEELIGCFNQLLGKTFKSYEYFDELTFQLVDESTLEDFYEEALKFEKAGDYKRAILQYKQLNLDKCQRRINYCEAALLMDEGKYEAAAHYFEANGEYDEAIKCYQKAKNDSAYYKKLLKYHETRFVSEVILGEVDYSKVVMPYLDEGEQKQVEALCTSLCEQQVELEIEEIKYQHLLVEELIIGCHKITKKWKSLEEGNRNDANRSINN